MYAEEDTSLLHVLTIGDKDSQPGDIRHCEEFVEQSSSRKEKVQADRDETRTEQNKQSSKGPGNGERMAMQRTVPLPLSS